MIAYLTHRIEHEAVDTVASRQNDHGGTTVERVASRHQVPARLQCVTDTCRTLAGLRKTMKTHTMKQQCKEQVRNLQKQECNKTHTVVI